MLTTSRHLMVCVVGLAGTKMLRVQEEVVRVTLRRRGMYTNWWTEKLKNKGEDFKECRRAWKLKIRGSVGEVPRYLWRALEGDALARGRGYKELNKDISIYLYFRIWRWDEDVERRLNPPWKAREYCCIALESCYRTNRLTRYLMKGSSVQVDGVKQKGTQRGWAREAVRISEDDNDNGRIKASKYWYTNESGIIWGGTCFKGYCIFCYGWNPTR